MDERQQKALVIAATATITKRGNETWIVPSQSKAGKYAVTVTTAGKECTCPDFELRQAPCKHIIAVQLVLFKESVTEAKPDGTVTTRTTEAAAVRVTYSQDWSAYNAAQTSEKEYFVRLLHSLCSDVPELSQTMGRPRLPLADMLFAACFKVYSGVSGRRFMTDLRDAQADGLISKAPHFNSVFNVLGDEEVTPIIHDMITRSALPLRAIESDFAVDSTGFTSTQLVGLWQQTKYGTKVARKEHDWLKLHAMCGTKTNVVAAVAITPRNSQDSPQFPALLEHTAEHFNVARVMGDKAYSSYRNLELAEARGIEPFIPFKNYATGTTKSRVWNKLFHYFSMNRDEFLSTYHARSNAESTFSSIKRKFGDFVRSKTPVAQTNELLLKVLCHNLVVLIHEAHELGVAPMLDQIFCTNSHAAAQELPAL